MGKETYLMLRSKVAEADRLTDPSSSSSLFKESWLDYPLLRSVKNMEVLAS